MKKIWTTFFFLIMIGLSAREMAGKVTAIEGSAIASFPSRKDRALVKGSPVFSEEKIVVGSNSKLQIKFTDDAILNLTPNTEYTINDYSYKDKRRPNTYLGEIFKGGFRHLTGKIAKENPDAVTIKGPTVTIGIRGTVIQASIGFGGTMFVGCEYGLITVTSREGSLTLGPSAQYRYSSVSEDSLKPKGLTTIPSALTTPNLASPPGGIPTSPTGPVPTAAKTAPPAEKQAAPAAEKQIAPGAEKQAAPAESKPNVINIKGGC